MRTALIKSASVLLGLSAVVGAYLYWAWNHPLEPGDEIYALEPGMTLRAFARELSERGVFPEGQSFVWLAYFSGHSRDLKAGEYRFRDGMTARELLDQVVAGRVVEYPVTLVEGWTFRQFVQAMQKAPKMLRAVAGLSPNAIMEKLGHPGEHPEGWFFPDTYYYANGQSDLMILAKAREKMQALLQQEWEGRDGNLPFQTPYEALILASVVEKETGLEEERRTIAGAFINRLRRGMKLQSDPTVIYGMGEAFDGNIRLKDLKRDTPYNTYTRAGLPPTPVAMPGRNSLQAVLHPADTRALYFVSRGNGGHEFSETLEEHNKAVIRYQLKGKPRNLSSHSAPVAPPKTSPP